MNSLQNEQHYIHDIHVTNIVVHYYGVLLKIFSTVELYLLRSLKVTCSNRACYSSMRPIFNKCSMTGNSVENYSFVVLNVKLQVKLRFKNNKRVIYGLGLNL